MNILAIALVFAFGFIIGMAVMALVLTEIREFKEERLEK